MGFVASLLTLAVALHASPTAPRERAFALLADNRVVALALPSGKLVARRQIGPSVSGETQPGRMLATSDTRLFALVSSRDAPDSIAVLDARTLKILARWRLDEGVRYRGIVFAADRLYAYGGRLGREVDVTHHLHEESAVVTELDAANGTKARTLEIRPADGRTWWIYWAAANGTRFALSYHGGCFPEAIQLCTSGADSVESSGGTVYRLEQTHGMIEPYGVGWIAATGGESLVQYGRDGKLLRRLHTGIQRDHLMNFGLSPDRQSVVVVSSCLYSHEGIRRISIPTGTSRLLRGKTCGEAAVPGRTALVVRQGREVQIRDPRSARLRRTLTFGANVRAAIVTG